MAWLWPWQAGKKFAELESRVKDVERHFVTKRDSDGKPTETLADVPLEKRHELKSPMKGMNWTQRRQWLERTDGGRKLA
jgi:hypothetical protein